MGMTFFVCGDLEDAVAGGVDDWFAGANVLGAEFFQDFRAGSGFVAEDFAANLLFECADDFRREAVAGKWGKACGSQMPAISQWPVVVSLPGECVADLP